MIKRLLFLILYSNLAFANSAIEILIETVTFSGSSIFTNAQLQSVAAPFLHRTLDSGDLEELRYRFTRLYVDAGYVNSGAIIDGYDANTKQLRIRLQEGKLSAIRVKATGWLSAQYIEERLKLAQQVPFHLPTLQERFMLLMEDPVVDTLHGAIVPGTVPGEAALETETSGRHPLQIRLTLDNRSSVSLGEKRALLDITLRGLSGGGEIINFGVSGSDGNKRGYLNTSIPITPEDTRIHFLAERSNSSIIEEPMDVLDIKGDYSAYQFGINHPLVRNAKDIVNLGMSLGRRSNKSHLLGMPFSFSQGATRGRATSIPLRFNQAWLNRGTTYAYTIDSTLSFGLDIGDATPTHGPVDSKFTTWLLQQRYTQKLDKSWQFIGRMDMQFADSPLLVVEQTAIGGSNTVRGYRENILIRDQVMLASLELRYSLLDTAMQSEYGRLDGAIFTDAAYAWNRGKNDDATIHSIGLGLLWSWQDYLQAQVYWGHPLQDPPQHTSGTWQDEGFHVLLQATY